MNMENILVQNEELECVGTWFAISEMKSEGLVILDALK